MTTPRKEREETLVADNRKAGHDYHLLQQFEAGIVLAGTEVNAAREGRVGVLLVAENDKVWGHFREDYHRAFPLHHETDGAIDLVEEAATETLLRGGEVHVVTKDELPSGASTAAILRF